MSRERGSGIGTRRWAVMAAAAGLFTALRGLAFVHGQVEREIAARRDAERQGADLRRLADERRRLALEAVATEEETRRRIAEELHDGALQTLLAAKQDLLEASAGRAGVVRALMGMDEGIDGLRRAVGVLHPVTFEHGGLASAFDAIAAEAERRGGFHCEVEVDSGAGGSHDQVILSLGRELLTNAAKHSDATRVSVNVSRDNGSLVLEVADDGRGFGAAERHTDACNGHIGLAAAERRARALGGALRTSSDPGSGTAVSVVLPVAAAGQ